MLSRTERCSLESEERHEPMAGTASTVRSWLLLEHTGPWGRDALADARLPEGLGAELAGRCRDAGVRPLLIRRVGARTQAGVTCFAIRSGPEPPWIERTTLDRLEGALELDLPGLGGGERPGLERHEAPLFLVCTHGRRDVCCAERGRPLAQSLARAFPEETWESSHVGGDRFAGNVVAFPHGLYLGRVAPDEAPDVARAYASGRVSLAHLRGRSCHAMPVQAAEHALRTREGMDGVDDVELEEDGRVDEEVVATFGTSGGQFRVRIEVGEAEPHFLTCHSTRQERSPTYRVIGIERSENE